MSQVRSLGLHKERKSIKEGVSEGNTKTFIFLVLFFFSSGRWKGAWREAEGES